MKKRKVLLAAVICIFLGGIILSIGWVMGGRGIRFDSSSKDKFKLMGSAREYSVYDMDYEAFKGVLIDVPDCDIYVGRSENGKFGVDMRLTIYDDEDVEFYVTDEKNGQPGYLVIKNNSESPALSFNFDFFSQNEQYIKLYIPDGNYDYICAGSSNSSITFEDVSAKNEIGADCKNGSITLKNVSADYVFAQTTNSTAVVEDVSAQRLRVETTNGNILLKNAAADSVDASTSNGKVELDDVSGADAVVKTSNGQIVFDNVDFNNRIEAQTSNSSIKAVFAGKNSDYSYDLKTSNADISLDGDKLGTKYKGGSGQIDVKLKTSNGDITVKYN